MNSFMILSVISGVAALVAVYAVVRNAVLLKNTATESTAATHHADRLGAASSLILIFGAIPFIAVAAETASDTHKAAAILGSIVVTIATYLVVSTVALRLHKARGTITSTPEYL